MYTLSNIADVIGARPIGGGDNSRVVAHLLHDSRGVSFPESSLFFALVTRRSDGHHYIGDAYRKGVRAFVVSEPINVDEFPAASFLQVTNSLHALQALAAWHRAHFSIPVIGITGSNGKTIVKEWLFQLLEPEYRIVRSPRSYNSQIGVALSVWMLRPEHTLALFEAGISEAGEMERLALMIRPDIGVLTNIGSAHDEGFVSTEQKRSEKGRLFEGARVVIGPEPWTGLLPHHVSWGQESGAGLRIESIRREGSETRVAASYRGVTVEIRAPFSDEASVANALTCATVLIYLGYSIDTINNRLAALQAVDMRLQLKRGANGCTLINDSYSADLTSLQHALHFMGGQQTGQPRTVILSDFTEAGTQPERFYTQVAAALEAAGVRKCVLIGEGIGRHLVLPADVQRFAYRDTDAFLAQYRPGLFRDETILIKGGRSFRFERIVAALETRVHQTVLEIDLNALAGNLKQYRALLRPQTKVMAMVKAFSYGSGSAEIASILQYHHVDYLGVAYADEGVALRQSGIALPIMVMNADASSFDALIEYQLQPVIYSFPILEAFERYLQREGLQSWPVHIELETGMNRLGFSALEIDALARHLQGTGWLRVQSVFSHLAASEDPAQDDFTREQAARYEAMTAKLKSALGYRFLEHISNSAAIIRHPQLQYDLVRLGIGMYGVEIETKQLELHAVATLRSTIAQLKYLEAGETVSYNRRGVVKEASVIATVRIGYADGYSRRLGYGIGKMWVRGHLAPVIGTVCMDMTMIDVTHVPGVEVGDEVEVFGQELPVQQVAEWMGTIPYEIMTGVSQRVKRVYFQE
ncbi:bifunctional UDP-N-acetylmuramoyl-tripeptide:D-alanyl-D-alanine ligase/alanine racemase [Flaviaesturariibacter flavus]|uniref:Alanine racemase n=1 Tax=Flaviaesturariibacter flavus TaxID=2502780 RepID=A0A4R1B7W3_9BACT|nr:bifunctional UDP-N-acetylmuramoyl-tripeptide:D-alanyl-D-alanine ligase/alanine racemase [Flaviaesturariibacter flavus]TCJ13267.1 bifunctional UDP-N-acetylmuramoyl-tripeptide:D-alanyl-D-alanine ligase/alanine racemase [Flaviaesturariibacter flavus]